MVGLYVHQNLLRGTIEASTQVGAIFLTLPSLHKSIFIALLDALKSLQHYNDILTNAIFEVSKGSRKILS